MQNLLSDFFKEINMTGYRFTKKQKEALKDNVKEIINSDNENNVRNLMNTFSLKEDDQEVTDLKNIYKRRKDNFSSYSFKELLSLDGEFCDVNKLNELKNNKNIKWFYVDNENSRFSEEEVDCIKYQLTDEKGPIVTTYTIGYYPV